MEETKQIYFNQQGKKRKKRFFSSHYWDEISNYTNYFSHEDSSVLEVGCGSGGSYHSSSDESVLANIKGIKIDYPSTGENLKGLMKAAFYDPNPLVRLEHKGLYWIKIKGTEDAKTNEPDEDYVIPFRKARTVQTASEQNVSYGKSITIITYDIGVCSAKRASGNFQGKVEIIDLRTISPINEFAIFESASNHGKYILLTEDPVFISFEHSIDSRISQNCFKKLDAPVIVIDAENLSAIPFNSILEKTMLPNADKVEIAVQELLNY